MQTVDDKLETIHLYVVREVAPKPPLLPIVLSVLALASLVVLSVIVPYQQPVTRAVIRVQAIPLKTNTFTVQVAVIPTSITVHIATTAHGVLTITNGSIIAQVIPAGFRVQNVATDQAIYVPAGDANGYGYATVAAHALVNGKGGNFATLAINQVVGSSVYIRNLSPFYGGRDSYSVKFATTKDKQTALIKARSLLLMQIKGLHYPCQELYFSDASRVTMAWRCQFVTFHIPAFYHVTGVRIIGKNLLLDVWFVARPVRIWVK